MANLFDALHVSAGALRALQSALESSQNNVANASTPGYAAQRVSFQTLPSNPLVGLPGGVRATGPLDSRNLFAESAVWKQLHAGGYHGELTQQVALVAAQFDVSGNAGIPGAFNRFYQAASNWSVSPDSLVAREDFLRASDRLAAAFRDAAAGLGQTLSAIGRQVDGVTEQVNEIGARLADLNRARLRSAAPDAGLDARIFAALEELASLTDFTTLTASDGSLTVLVGGQTPLVLGESFQPIDPALSRATEGKLGGLLALRDQILPDTVADLDRLAEAFAARVNGILGQSVFTWTAGSEAATLSLASGVTAAGLPAEDPGPPPVSNGLPLALAALATSTDPADRIDGSTYVEFYGTIGSGVGQLHVGARDAASRHAGLTAQARKLRDEISGVSLDEEAVLVLQYQRGYQAAAQMVRVIDELTQSTIQMIG